MKKALLIVVAVAVYCLLLVVVSFSIDVPVIDYASSGTHQMTAGALLLLIPGLAAFFSRIMYGSYNWKRRLLLFVGCGAGCIPAAFLLVVLLFRAYSASMLLFVSLLVLLPSGVLVGLFFLIRKLLRHGIQLESTRWLAERQSGICSSKRRWRNRAIRYSLWIPSLTVLLVFLFLPQLLGIFSHRLPFQPRHLAGYQIRIPATWIIRDEWIQTESRQSYIDGVAARGLGFEIGRYVRWWYIPIAGWNVGTTEHALSSGYQAPDPTDADARREILIGNEDLTCLEHSSSYFYVHIECSGSKRLFAEFYGDRLGVPEFYKMLESITPEKNP